ncbi:hypothetical protein K3G39_01820 [Pontibacter sp. HSC-14F20]|uniref:hypothetical protein n=1 Tax=Pontibacter sp. HSC-14F20 TaxID=2864136 RepID=UPI001C72EA73|nr:hypothetical protein [Pontibacter sp. HSC-14F20]MBX0331969.1 hypothetical protein [Pontibacter sp. HSC-14F20]
MAQVSINDFDWNRDYYAYVCIGGYEGYSGRFRAWKLYSLTNDAVKTLSQRQEEVKALFETQEELEAYIKALRTQSIPDTEEIQLNKIGKEGGDQLTISSIL